MSSEQKLDFRGLMCPEPVLRTKKILDKKPDGNVEILVDSEINVMNLTRLANSLGLSLLSKETKEGYQVIIGAKTAEQFDSVSVPAKTDHTDAKNTAHEKQHTASLSSSKVGKIGNDAKTTTVVFIAKDTFGEGDRDFSVNLMNVFLQTILQSGHRPQAILLANTGVKLMDPDSSTSKVLADFKSAGVEVFACGLCVEFYGLKEKIQIEQITNMFAICEYLFSADKIISP